jgi:hypothetical protein
MEPIFKDLHTIEIKKERNPDFHRKVFSFFRFCFDYWFSGVDGPEYTNKQFEIFRNNMTVLCGCGYYDTLYTINGDSRVEAKSLSYGSMAQQDFEAFYQKLITVAMKKIFNSSDKETFNKLLSFFPPRFFSKQGRKHFEVFTPLNIFKAIFFASVIASIIDFIFSFL